LRVVGKFDASFLAGGIQASNCLYGIDEVFFGFDENCDAEKQDQQGNYCGIAYAPGTEFTFA
jgi:hypothetical protein